MAYYDAFIAAWNNGVTTLPSGAAGTLFLAGDTTAQKLAKLNAWTVAQAAVYSVVNGNAVLNCIALTDWNAITAAQQTQVGIVTGAYGGIDPTPGKFAAVTLGGIFSGKATTLNALTALQNSAKTIATPPWWQTAGYSRAFDLGDCATAGVS